MIDRIQIIRHEVVPRVIQAASIEAVDSQDFAFDPPRNGHSRISNLELGHPSDLSGTVYL
jgi:hypothetical protein